MFKLRTVTAAITLFFGALMASPAKAIETPKYQIVETHSFQGHAIEIREYASYIVAETVIDSGNLAEASNLGFRRLANYIFGGNHQGESVAMTAPVGTVGEPGKYTISFVMPSKYTLETLPVPNNEQVKIRAVPAKRVAALKFSGFWSESNFNRHIEALRAYLISGDISPRSVPMIARYNMPLTPWFLRTNEVLIDIP